MLQNKRMRIISKTYKKVRRNLIKRSLKISNHLTNEAKLQVKLNKTYEDSDDSNNGVKEW